MIEGIDIRGLGVIEHASLPLGPGFTAITGETGAGKTMVVTALGLLLGGRADPGAVRRGATQATVDGRWLVASDGPVAARIEEAGGLVDDIGDGRSEITLGRSVSAEGRSRAQVGGRAAPIGVLAELGDQLVVVHGQSEQIRLRSQTAQRDALDRFAGEPGRSALAGYTAAFDAWLAATDRLTLLTTQHDARQSEAENLRLALADIERVDPQPGEETELAALAERLTNAEELRIAAATAHEALSSEELGEGAADVAALIDHARRALDRAVSVDAALAPIAASLEALSYQAAETATDLARYLGTLDEAGAQELDQIQNRRSELAALVRKYGPSFEDVLALRERGSDRLLELDSDEDSIAALTAELDALLADLTARADELTAVRTVAAATLAAAVSDELSALAMGQAKLSLDISPLPEFAAHGRDQVTFLLAPHNGADPRPLAKGASGGELSRVMLALEVVIAGTDPVPTFVFDEVDAGVGGAAAIEIGRRLAHLAQNAQVIVVTHLAQVAAFATNHLAVVKADDGSVTASSVRQLHGDERLAEMARLLSGLTDSDSALAHAAELLDLNTSR